jgi:UDP-N-acetylglucosamine 2-epimerase (non-hydrolysing)
MRLLTVVGARPNFMKAAPIIAAIDRHNSGRSPRAESDEPIQHVLVHTGQHYDDRMSESFFTDLQLPKPDVFLGVGSGSHAVQTAEIMKSFEPVLLSARPDFVVLVGDVNSTVACAMVAAKISFDSDGSRPLIVHVEAGLRSFDRTMPEEVNRTVTDHVADQLFVTEESGLQNLIAEGIPAERIHFVGNTMIDSLLAFKEKAETSTILESLGLRARANGNDAISRYALMTLHRPANVDNSNAFLDIMTGIRELAIDCPVVFPVHPRTRRRLEEFGLDRSFGPNIILTDPAGYLDFLCLMKHAALVVTDSGGVQEETTCLGIPCVTVRENTERPVTVESGTNIVAGTEAERIKDAIRRQTGRQRGGDVPPKWDGRAAERILDVLIGIHCERAGRRGPLVSEAMLPTAGSFICR